MRLWRKYSATFKVLSAVLTKFYLFFVSRVSKEGGACIFMLYVSKYIIRGLLDIEGGGRTLLRNIGKHFLEYLNLIY
jgi:hypothetical protein